MLQNFIVATILAGTFVLLPTYINAACNLCSDHGIACINETSFNICSGKQPRTEKIYTCPSNKICTDTSKKCVNAAADGKPACETKKGCGKCDGSKIFACTSRTTFAKCNGQTLTNNTAACPDGLVCDNSSSGEICKTECNRPEILECDIDAPL